MAEKSNLYIEKAYSEHPVAIWALDETVDYISLIDESQRKFWLSSKWTLTGCSSSEQTSDKTTPFRDSAFSKISMNVPALEGDQATLESVYNINKNLIDSNLNNIGLSFYINKKSVYITSMEYGYKYYDSSSSSYIYDLKEKFFSESDTDKWIFISSTFNNPPSYSSDIKLVIRFTLSLGGTSSDYDMFINGLSFGQWSENFASESLGLTPNSISSSIPLPNSLYAIPAYQYSEQSNPAYYLCTNKNLFAKNFGIPMVYGSLNTTKIYPNIIDSVIYPSMIFPGYGFLNESGKYGEYTLEVWISVDTDSPDPVKILGPISGNDGLYIEDGFLTLVIDKKFASHYVGEWNRPMLLHIRYSHEHASVLINGEQVIYLTFESAPALCNNVDINNKSLDWIGVYSPNDLSTISIDSFVIYSYFVPAEVAKRRFVWGQAIVPPETTNAGLNATTAYNDFSFIKNGVNYSYPTFGKWKDAFFNNLEASSKFLSIPQYDCPEQHFQDFTKEDLCSALQEIQSEESTKYITFRPNSSWDNKTCYLLFNNFNIINEKIEYFYIIFDANDTLDNEPLIKIIDKYSKDYILISVENLQLKYTVFMDGNEEIIYTTSIVEGTKYAAGLNIPSLIQTEIEGVDRFFAIPDRLSVFIGGDSETTFTGKFYRVGFDGSYNARKFINTYLSDGVIIPTQSSFILTETSNYTLIPIEKYGQFFPDIASVGYWQDHMPLSYFAKYIEDFDGNKNYELDTIQINFDYPYPLERKSGEVTFSSTYQSLYSNYLLNERDYSYLANNIYTGFEDYEDLSQSSVKAIYYDTSRSHIRTFITFHKNSNPNKKLLVDYTSSYNPQSYGIVNTEPQDWDNEIFEVIDGSVIYVPKKKNNKPIDFNDYSIVVHIEFKTEGTTHHPINFKSLELSSSVLERTKFTALGTKLGVDVYPYVKRGIYFDFKEINPIQVYKGSTPHLYLTNNTGWRMRGYFGDTFERGLALPINSQKSNDYKISAIQVWMKYSEYDMPNSEIPIFTIDSGSDVYEFYLISDSSKLRGNIIGRSRKTGNLLSNVIYYINGKMSSSPSLVINDWTSLTLSFTSPIIFDEYVGTFNLVGPLIYNNISYYSATNLEISQNTVYSRWKTIKEQTWGSAKTGSWTDIFIFSSLDSITVNGSAIYSKYLGTERVLVDDNFNGVMVTPDTMKVYNEITWQTSTQIPL